MTDTPSQQDPQVSDPDSPTPTPQPTNKCYAHCHMSGTTYAIYDVCRSRAHKSGILYSDGDQIAKCFNPMSFKTAYRHINILHQTGWFSLLKASEKKSNGQNTTRHFRILSHEEWTKQHPGTCGDATTQNDNGRKTTTKNDNGQEKPVSYFPEPLSKRVHNLQEQLTRTKTTTTGISKPLSKRVMDITSEQLQSAEARQSEVAQPVSKRVMGVSDAPVAPVDDLVDRFGSRCKRKAKDATVAAIQPAPVITPAALADAVGKKLGFTSPLQTARWETTIQRIADRGSDLNIIRGVLSYYARKHADIMDWEGARGFEVAFPRLLTEHTQEQLQTLNVPTGQKGETHDAA